MPLWMFVWLWAAAGRLASRAGRRAGPARPGGAEAVGARADGVRAGDVRAGGPGAVAARAGGGEAGFSTAEGLAGAALAVVALIAIWAAMRAFGLDIIKWMQDQITSSGGGG